MKTQNIDESLAEASSEIKNIGGLVVGGLIQRRGVSRTKKVGGSKRLDSPMNSATYLGKGKAFELAEIATIECADTLIFLNKLSGTQIRNLAKITGCRVYFYESA
ncbi:hypothetical protein MO867_20905 [Microbulbifer sp. OS29]|uniref:GTPase HflX N-terminal domain-containing protein n=1 Tax=Microbulbifer okhotskensis TaxID=2926617 RepID=A0A9X2ES60_9GAMM|nr:hypothetical protein [Microbulbifer okhotskensis]MCO1336790.1 hypothetical protein [Microbulbifer okhotskensis]